MKTCFLVIPFLIRLLAAQQNGPSEGQSRDYPSLADSCRRGTVTEQTSQQYLNVIRDWIAAVDAAKGNKEMVTKNLLAYAQIYSEFEKAPDAFKKLQLKYYDEIAATLHDRVNRWSDPLGYYQSNMESAKALWNDQHYKFCKSHLINALSVAPSEAESGILLLIAVTNLQSGKNRQAVQILKDLTQISHPDHIRASSHFLLAHLNWISLEYRVASSHFEQAGALFPPFYQDQVQKLRTLFDGKGGDSK